MCRAGFPVVDVLHLSRSYPEGTYDHAHYHNRVFLPLINLLERLKAQPDEIYRERHDTKLVKCVD